MLMCKNNSVNQHALKHTVLIPSWFPTNTNGIACHVLILFFNEHKRSRSHYNLGLAWNLNKFRKHSFEHQPLAKKAYSDAGSLLTPVRANQMPLLNLKDWRRARRFNTLLSKRRVKIEHDFKELTTNKAVDRFGGNNAGSCRCAWSSLLFYLKEERDSSKQSLRHREK